MGTRNADDPDTLCRSDCTLPRCGDWIVDQVEQCDDGNILNGDGCSGFCLRESTVAPAYTTASSASSRLEVSSVQSSSAPASPLFATLRAFEPWGKRVRVSPQGPAGETGPASIAVMAAGAAAGLAWMRRKRRGQE